MPLFRRQQSGFRLPDNIVQMMTVVGKFEFDSEGFDNVDEFTQIYPRLYPLAQSNPDEFVSALAKAVLPVGGWAVYGGTKTVFNLLGQEYNDRNYRIMLSAALHFLRENGASRNDLNSYEWEFWIENEGGPDSWPI